MRSHRQLFAAVLLAAAVHSRGAVAQGDEDDGRGRDANCTAGFDRERINGTLNVIGRCELDRTDVRGDVILFAGGSLIARGARIRGTLAGNRADFVDLDDVRIDRGLDLQELVGDSSRIESSDIRGNTVLTGNRSRLEILDNQLGDLRVVGNTGGVLISQNTIDGDVECSGNAPAPTGVGNRIEGDAEGQCAVLDPQPEPETPPPAAPPPTPSPPMRPPPSTSPLPPEASTPPPSTSPPPPATSPPPAASTPPATIAPPPATPVPPASPPAATEPPLIDDGGAGALGWPMIALLLPLLAWRWRRRSGF